MSETLTSFKPLPGSENHVNHGISILHELARPGIIPPWDGSIATMYDPATMSIEQIAREFESFFEFHGQPSEIYHRGIVPDGASGISDISNKVWDSLKVFYDRNAIKHISVPTGWDGQGSAPGVYLQLQVRLERHEHGESVSSVPYMLEFIRVEGEHGHD